MRFSRRLRPGAGVVCRGMERLWGGEGTLWRMRRMGGRGMRRVGEKDMRRRDREVIEGWRLDMLRWCKVDFRSCGPSRG